MSAVLLVCDREKLSLPSGSQQANRVIMGDKECDFYGGDDDDNDDGDDDDNDDDDDNLCVPSESQQAHRVTAG